jgi:hypothetical protein
MLFIYEHHQPDDRVVVLTIQDARSSSAATQGQFIAPNDAEPEHPKTQSRC